MEEEINDIIDNDIVQKYIDIASIKFSKKARYTVKNVSVNIEKLFNIIKLSNDIPVIRRLNTLKDLRDFNYKHYRKFIFNDANQLKSLKFNIQVVVESGGIYSNIFINENGRVLIVLELLSGMSEIKNIAWDALNKLKEYIDITPDTYIELETGDFEMNIFPVDNIENLVENEIKGEFKVKSNNEYTSLVYRGNTVIIRIPSDDSMYNMHVTQIQNVKDIPDIVEKLYNDIAQGLPNKYITQSRIEIKSNKKNSKNCQDGNKFAIYNPNTIKPIYTLPYQSKQIYCFDDAKQYPGYSVTGTPCCYNKEQRLLQKFKQFHPGDKYMPSNIIVKVNGVDKFVFKKKETSKYYYFESNKPNQVTDIDALNYIDRIIGNTDKTKTIFTQASPIETLISGVASNKCKKKPVNGECTGKSKLGYDKHGDLCCFETVPLYFNVCPKLDEFKVVAKSNKVPISNELVPIQGELQGVFKPEYGNFYTLGVEDDKSNFLNCIVASDCKSFVNASNLRIMMVKFLEDNYLSFEGLNKGKLYQKYKRINVFKGVILDEKTPLVIEDNIELLTNVIGKNIIVLESESRRMRCYRMNKNINVYIVIVYRDNVYTLLVDANIKESGDKRSVVKIGTIFESSNPAIQSLLVRRKKSCKVKSITPTLYSWKPGYTHGYWMKSLNVIGQLFNANFKTNLLITQNGMLVPIIETNFIPGVKILTRISVSNLHDLNSTIDFYKGTDIILKGVTLDNKGDVNAVLTDTGALIPVKPSKKETDLPVLPYKYYYNIDSIILGKNTDSPQTLLSKSIEEYHSQKFYIKTGIYHNMFGDGSDSKIKEIILEKQKSRKRKVGELVEVLRKLYTGEIVNDVDHEFILKSIATDLTNDVKLDFINGKFNSYSELIIRETEAIVSSFGELEQIYS